MNPIPLIYRLFRGSWAEIKAEVNEFAQRRGLNTYTDDPKRYRFTGWGIVHRFIACNVTYLYGGEPAGVEATPKYGVLQELRVGWRFIANGVHDGRGLVAIRWVEDGEPRQNDHYSLSEAKQMLNLFADNQACVYDPWTGLYWVKQGGDRAFIEHGINELRQDFELQPKLILGGWI